MHFCPVCGNLLLIEESSLGMRFCCVTCPYSHQLAKKYSRSAGGLKKKIVDEQVLGGTQDWENVDRTEAKCPFCGHNLAYFLQIQIRSADEPSTNFYKCVECKKQWND